MDRLPAEALFKILFYLPSTELGRVATVSRSWNNFLTTTPNLWTEMQLPNDVSFERAHQIIKVFTNRSHSTLKSVFFPVRLQDFEAAEIMQLLDPSRPTLRAVLLDLSAVSLCRSLFGQVSFLQFFCSCPNIEQLYLGGLTTGGTQVATSSGILTHFSCKDLDSMTTTQLSRLSNLKFFEIIRGCTSEFLQVLSRCRETLKDLRISGTYYCSVGDRLQVMISDRLPSLRLLHIQVYSNLCCGGPFPEFQSPKLEGIGINPLNSTSLGPFKKLTHLTLQLPHFDEAHDEDHRLEALQSVIEILILIKILYKSWNSQSSIPKKISPILWIKSWSFSESIWCWELHVQSLDRFSYHLKPALVPFC